MEQVKTSLFQQALDVVEKLPPEDQETLVDLIRRRLVEWRRDEIAHNTTTTLQTVREGHARYGMVTLIESLPKNGTTGSRYQSGSGHTRLCLCRQAKGQRLRIERHQLYAARRQLSACHRRADLLARAGYPFAYFSR